MSCPADLEDCLVGGGGGRIFGFDIDPGSVLGAVLISRAVSDAASPDAAAACLGGGGAGLFEAFDALDSSE